MPYIFWTCLAAPRKCGFTARSRPIPLSTAKYEHPLFEICHESESQQKDMIIPSVSILAESPIDSQRMMAKLPKRKIIHLILERPPIFKAFFWLYLLQETDGQRNDCIKSNTFSSHTHLISCELSKLTRY